MPQTSYPFPMYSGLLEPGHYNKIGSAIWLFLWCVSATTAEKEKEGTVWGIVLGNKPIKREDLASQFGVAERTVQRWIDTLEQQGYIRITRAPYGMIFTVRKSKKFVDRLDNNVQSPPERVDKNVQSEPQEWTEMSSLSSERADKNVHSNKDIIKDLDVDAVDDRDSEFESILKAYCEIHQKLDMQVRPLDIKLMQEMIALGVPPPLIIRVMQQVHQLKMARSERIQLRFLQKRHHGCLGSGKSHNRRGANPRGGATPPGRPWLTAAEDQAATRFGRIRPHAGGGDARWKWQRSSV
ncbi:hypothetical protein [Cohnella cellulosilytica]|uniref:hypothetical protein n=1 Tax=Cohnella cellulosilytica TaxID=986710 RepID=UPI00362425B4